MTHADLVTRISQQAQTVKLKPRKGRSSDGRRARLLKPSLLAPVLSTLRTALIWQVAQRYGLDGKAAEARLIAGEDVAPYLPDTPQAAYERASQRTGATSTVSRRHTAPANARYLATLGLRLLDPRRFTQAWSKGGAVAVPEAYQAVVDSVVAAYAGSGPHTRRSQETCIRAFASAAWRAGWHTPYLVPTDRDAVAATLRQVGLGKESYIQLAINSHSRGVRLLNERGQTPPLPVISQRIDARELGLRTLPAEAFGGHVADPSHESAETLLSIVAPKIAVIWQTYATESRGRGEKAKMRDQRLGQLGRLAAVLWLRRDLLALARSPAGEQVPAQVIDVALEDLYLIEVPVVQGGEATPVTSTEQPEQRSGYAAHLRTRVGSMVTDVEYVPLIRALLDELVRRSKAQTSGRRRRATVPVGPAAEGVFTTTTKVLRDVLSDAAGADDGMAAKLRPMRERIELVHRTVAADIKRLNSDAIKRGQATASGRRKDLLARVLTLPWLVCIGLPRLAGEVRELEAAYHAMRALVVAKRHLKPDSHSRVVEAKRAWVETLETYVALAVFMADPLRLSNLAYGLLGTGSRGQMRLTVEWHPRTGAPVRIQAVESEFFDALRQPDNVLAALKQKGKHHVWRWWPAIIDLDLLLRYIMGPRRERIIARGLLTDAQNQPVTAESYLLQDELAQATLTLFVSPDNPDKAGKFAYHGGYASDSMLSAMVGRGMHRVAREILGHQDVPPFAECPGSDWEGLFSGHPARDHWATYWAGIRGKQGQHPVLADGTRVSGRQIAEDATTDEGRTLDKHYVSVSAIVRQQLMQPATSWRHPRAHDAWMDRALRGEAIDWSVEDPPRPEHLASLATPVPQPVRSRRKGRATAEATTPRHIRRARTSKRADLP